MENKAQFRFSPEILSRLGEELNPYPDQGILELVKNSYDADAINCTVEIINSSSTGGKIYITDDGEGMDLDGIKEGWLILGKSPKSIRTRTKLGRFPAGSKGLGRLAALRLGKRAKLITRPISDPNIQYELMIDWSLFENANIVENVDLIITISQNNKNSNNGTEIIIEDLNLSIERTEMKRLSRSLILLADPFGDNPIGFKPKLITDEFKDLEELVQKRYFDQSDYHLIAELDQLGFATTRVEDWRGQIIFSSTQGEMNPGRKDKPYRCPPARFDLWVFLLDSANFSMKTVTVKEVKNWLSEFGGVHLYENGIRVAPYGNPGNDWLGMNLRRAQSPEERPSTNTVIGRVSINDENEMILQKTDRSGFIEGVAFSELQEFAQDSMEWLANRRMEIAIEKRAKKKAENKRFTRRTKKIVEEVIDKAPPAIKDSLSLAFSSYDRSREKEVNDLKKEVQLYRTLSTAGITAATFAHESSGNSIKVITQSIQAIERRGLKELKTQYKDLFEHPVNGIKKSIDSLAVLGNATLQLLDHEKRRIEKVDLNDVITGILDIFDPFLKGRDIIVEIYLCEGKPYIRSNKAAIESIITNLINNSVRAFETIAVKNRIIQISTLVENKIYFLHVVDNGPGIKDISLKDIWLPGKSTRPDGTGLGLAIVRDTVLELGGDVSAKAKSNLGGAEIVIQIPVLGV